MAGYFNDGNGVKNITDGYFYDGDVKYYKDVVTTKYWKEVETTVKGDLEYGCYNNQNAYVYAKAPIGSNLDQYLVSSGGMAGSSEDLTKAYVPFVTVTEDTVVLDLSGLGYGVTTYTRYRDGDLYIETTATETVEGTPEDYTHTTTENTTVEVSADDEYDYKEYYPKKIKQIYKVINEEAKLIFNNE